MAEERISVHICSNKCRCLREISENFDVVGLPEGTYCAAYIHGAWQKIDPEKDCKDCSRAQYNGISRSEAVERMAAAMCMRANRIFDCTDCLTAAKGDCEVRLYHNMAKAALDALIKKED